MVKNQNSRNSKCETIESKGGDKTKSEVKTEKFDKKDSKIMPNMNISHWGLVTDEKDDWQ